LPAVNNVQNEFSFHQRLAVQAYALTVIIIFFVRKFVGCGHIHYSTAKRQTALLVKAVYPFFRGNQMHNA
jgi:hypothetical protein